MGNTSSWLSQDQENLKSFMEVFSPSINEEELEGDGFAYTASPSSGLQKAFDGATMATESLQPTIPGMKYVCRFCRKEFYDKTKFTIHYMVHTGEKPYACPKCLYRSNRKASVKIHIRMRHSDEKYVSCFRQS